MRPTGFFCGFGRKRVHFLPSYNRKIKNTPSSPPPGPGFPLSFYPLKAVTVLWNEGNTPLLLFLRVLPGGIVDAVAGGGGLITLPAYLLAGLDPHAASATNKCGNVWGTLLSAYRFWRRGEIRMPSAAWGAAGALAGAWAGAKLNLILPDQFLYYIMLAIVPVMAVFLLLKRDFGTEDRSGQVSPAPPLLLSLAIGLAVGCYDGFFSAPERAPSSCWPIPASANSICSPPPATQRRPTPPPTPPPWSPSPWRARWFGP